MCINGMGATYHRQHPSLAPKASTNHLTTYIYITEYRVQVLRQRTHYYQSLATASTTTDPAATCSDTGAYVHSSTHRTRQVTGRQAGMKWSEAALNNITMQRCSKHSVHARGHERLTVCHHHTSEGGQEVAGPGQPPLPPSHHTSFVRRGHVASTPGGRLLLLLQFIGVVRILSPSFITLGVWPYIAIWWLVEFTKTTFINQ